MQWKRNICYCSCLRTPIDTRHNYWQRRCGQKEKKRTEPHGLLCAEQPHSEEVSKIAPDAASNSSPYRYRLVFPRRGAHDDECLPKDTTHRTPDEQWNSYRRNKSFRERCGCGPGYRDLGSVAMFGQNFVASVLDDWWLLAKRLRILRSPSLSWRLVAQEIFGAFCNCSGCSSRFFSGVCQFLKACFLWILRGGNFWTRLLCFCVCNLRKIKALNKRGVSSSSVPASWLISRFQFISTSSCGIPSLASASRLQNGEKAKFELFFPWRLCCRRT